MQEPYQFAKESQRVANKGVCLKFIYRVFESPKTLLWEKGPLALSAERNSKPSHRNSLKKHGEAYRIQLLRVLGRFPQKPDTARQGGAFTSPFLWSPNSWAQGKAMDFLTTKDTRLELDSLWVTMVRSRAKLFFESFISSDVSCQPSEGFPQKLPHRVCALYQFSNYSSRDVSDPLFSLIKTFCLIWQTGGKF